MATPAKCEDVSSNTFIQFGDQHMKYNPKDGTLMPATSDQEVPLFQHAFMDPEILANGPLVSPIFESNVTASISTGLIPEEAANARYVTTQQCHI